MTDTATTDATAGIVITTIERRTRPGLLSSLVFGGPATDDRAGLYAELETDGNHLQLSKLDGEAEWVVDAAYGPGSFPLWANGYGARYLRVKVVTGTVAALLDSAAAGLPQ